MIAVMFLGRMADLAGVGSVEFPPARQGDSPSPLRDRLLGTALVAAQAEVNAVWMSLNRVVSPGDRAVTDADEFAFFSVFSGG